MHAVTIGAVLAYVLLVVAIVTEVVGTSLIKATDGFTRLWPTVGFVASYATSFWMLSHIVKELPVGVVYAIWAGLGTVAIVAVAAVFLDEPITVAKGIGIALVIAGVVVLNLSGAH